MKKSFHHASGHVYRKTGNAPFYFLSLILISLSGCHHFNNGTTANKMSWFDSLNLKSQEYGLRESLSSPLTLNALYDKHKHKPLWFKGENETKLADSMIVMIRAAKLYGLKSTEYHLHEIEAALDSTQTPDKRQRIETIDVLLTDAFVKMAHHLKHGKYLSNSDSVLRASVDTIAMAKLESVLQGSALKKTLQSLEPGYWMYKQLRSRLVDIYTYRNTPKALGDTTVHPYDSITEMNIATLEINLDRWRYESSLNDRYILVNIPSYLLDVVEKKEPVMELRVVVGSIETPTPVLDGIIKSFTLFPFWTVPRKIAVEEILPHVKQDSSYLKSHRYQVLDMAGNVINPELIGDWSTYNKNNFPFMLRQKEGYDNALGMIKFTFKNPYNVYLHDTNARRAFKRSKRALSHGCVRVDRALDLAHYMVKEDSVYCSPEDLDQYVEMKENLIIKVLHPIPVHLRYFTCEVRHGRIKFYEDIYHLDQVVLEKFYPELLPQLQPTNLL
jgi:murein L,D-transpeptidase YcbB/YkuD